MKHRNTTKTFAMAAVAALALAIAPAAKAQVNKGCNNATLLGTFGYTVSGSFVAAPAPLGLYAEAGAQTFDGNGNTASMECQIPTAPLRRRRARVPTP